MLRCVGSLARVVVPARSANGTDYVRVPFMERFVTQLLEHTDLSATALAQRSGVSRSSQFRIDSGSTDPRVGTLRNLAIAAGFDLNISPVALSDHDAARAARVLLDATYPPDSSREVQDWVVRLSRLAGDNPVDIVRTAGQCSTLLKRAGAVFLAGNADEMKIVGAGAYSGAPWLLSGSGVLMRMGNTGASINGPRILYSGDSHRVVRLLDNMEPTRPERADLIITDYSAGIETDAWADGDVRLVAPIQALIDSLGIGGPLAEAAELIARSW